jgi:CheY-like chemotaxis protein
LALVHAIARDQGGAIDVATTLGKGTKFTVYLPLAPSASAHAGDATPAARGNGQTVLVVDDDRLVLAMAEEMLARLGYEPVGYDSSLRALEAFQARPDRFDAMLADQRMPDLTGTELAARVRLLRPHLPIIIATGYGGTDLEARAKEAGVVAVIGKPYTPEQLAQAMARAIPEQKMEERKTEAAR